MGCYILGSWGNLIVPFGKPEIFLLPIYYHSEILNEKEICFSFVKQKHLCEKEMEIEQKECLLILTLHRQTNFRKKIYLSSIFRHQFPQMGVRWLWQCWETVCILRAGGQPGAGIWQAGDRDCSVPKPTQLNVRSLLSLSVQ